MVSWHKHLAILSIALAWGTVGINAAGASDRPAASAGDIGFYIDTAGFRASEGRTYQEIYFLLPGHQLAFEPDDAGVPTATFAVDVCVQNAEGDTVRYERMRRRTQAGEEDGAQGASAVLDLFLLALNPGDGTLTVTVQDERSGKEGMCRIALPVVAFDQEHLAISGIQFGSQIAQAEGEDKFVKNGMRVTPNVMRRVSSESPVLYAYFEIYNFAQDPNAKTDSFNLYCAVVDSSGAEVKPFPGKRIRKPGSSCVNTESLDLSDLSPGDYDLMVMVKDNLNGQRVIKKRGFTLLPPGAPSANLGLDDAALQRYYDGIKYLATQQELETYRSLTPEGKRDFVVAFWKQKDPTPGSPENEFALKHFRQMQFADTQFQEGKRKGSDTDRGRVFIRYGPPSDIQRYMTRSIGKAYQIWTYQKTGNYEFVFIDRRGAGAYELVHSSMPGERYNPYWKVDRLDEKRPGDLQDIPPTTEEPEEQ